MARHCWSFRSERSRTTGLMTSSFWSTTQQTRSKPSSSSASFPAGCAFSTMASRAERRAPSWHAWTTWTIDSSSSMATRCSTSISGTCWPHTRLRVRMPRCCCIRTTIRRIRTWWKSMPPVGCRRFMVTRTRMAPSCATSSMLPSTSSKRRRSWLGATFPCPVISPRISFRPWCAPGRTSRAMSASSTSRTWARPSDSTRWKSTCVQAWSSALAGSTCKRLCSWTGTEPSMCFATMCAGPRISNFFRMPLKRCVHSTTRSTASSW
ncbi:hypothetical protein D3C71_1412680 [compost metagenome]